MTKPARLEGLYHRDSTVPGEDDQSQVAAAAAECSEDAYIARCVEVAWNVLKAAGYDTRRLVGFLKADTANKSLEHHLAACVIAHAYQMAAALKNNRILAVRRHALLFQQAVGQAIHLTAWGPDVLKQHARAEASRNALAAHNARIQAEAERFWAPWQEQYRELLEAGWRKDAARREIAARIDAEHGEPISWATIKKWLR